MKEVYRQPHPEVCDMWSCLQCFCREPATLQQSHSPANPDRLFVTCSKKKCRFFRWADQPLGPKYWTWFHDNPPKKAAYQAEPPHERTDKALTVSIVSRREFFGFSWEGVKICLTVGNQAIIAS